MPVSNVPTPKPEKEDIEIPMDRSLLASASDWLAVKVFMPLEAAWIRFSQFCPKAGE